ncbi:MAG: 23S rRNA (adenine(2030)-N(6))-methyltransferase RlmJ [Holophagaceae bacterium]|nr:23S rRNA (adenine(2030)-N(6))-methyltransferase RlmJ [Holophagaceae bacterium]
MANRHFAAFGDVWKHLPLAEVLKLNPPKHYWETHAGSVTYPLTDSPTRLQGAIRFLSRAATDRMLAQSEYLKVLHSMPGIYPGSAALAIQTLQTSASYVFCDMDPESAMGLRQATSSLDALIVEGDGVAAVATMAASISIERPSDVFVHIDPFDPFERITEGSMTPIELAAFLARRGFRVFYWYGYESTDERGWARAEISKLAPGIPLWCGDSLIPSLFVYPGRAGGWGCGIVMANMSDAEMSACSELGRALEHISADDVLPHNQPERVHFRVIGG